MKRSTVCFGIVAISFGALAGAQSPARTPQARPDAAYPKPSGQDSNPSKTEVRPTETPKGAKTEPSQTPRAGDSSQKAAASPETYAGASGKKANVAGGCSTPTDARSAGVQASDAAAPGQKPKQKVVCTTSGGPDSKPR
jgi:hypothetical protein